MLCGHPLPLPLGEVAERSEDGEGKWVRKALSVTFGDSSPRGRAKGLDMLAQEMEHIDTDTLHPLFYGRPFNLPALTLFLLSRPVCIRIDNAVYQHFLRPELQVSTVMEIFSNSS